MIQNDNPQIPPTTLTHLNQVASILLGWKTSNYQKWVEKVFSYLDRKLFLDIGSTSHFENLILEEINHDLTEFLKKLTRS